MICNVQSDQYFYRPQKKLQEGIIYRGVCLSTGGVSVSVKVGWLCPGGSLSRGFSVMETPHTVMSGQYTSYLNGFLLHVL